MGRLTGSEAIDEFRGDHAFLSNFYEHEQTGPSGLIYPTAEAVFQSAKTGNVEDRKRIAAAATPNEAKRLGQRVLLYPDWDATRRHAVMRAVIRDKFDDPDLAGQLVATSDAELIEGNTWHDQFWGDCRCGRLGCEAPGENWLGLYLVELRAELKYRSRLEQVKTMTRSVSQFKNYRDCGYRYKLEKIDRVWQRPAAWFPMGSAVHRAAEVYELTGRRLTLAEAQAVFEVSYADEVNEYLAVSPNMTEWFSSGQYGGEEDIPRRHDVGMDQVAKYLVYYGEGGKAADVRVWRTPDGDPAIELGFEVELGGVVVRGFIDAVMVMPDGTIVVVDNKTGANPGDEFQLKVYAEALRIAYGLTVTTGYYWMGKTGKLTKPYDLTTWSSEDVAAAFAAMDEAVKAERFEPNPGPNCARCGVAESCPFRSA